MATEVATDLYSNVFDCRNDSFINPLCSLSGHATKSVKNQHRNTEMRTYIPGTKDSLNPGSRFTNKFAIQQCKQLDRDRSAVGMQSRPVFVDGIACAPR